MYREIRPYANSILWDDNNNNNNSIRSGLKLRFGVVISMKEVYKSYLVDDVKDLKFTTCPL